MSSYLNDISSSAESSHLFLLLAAAALCSIAYLLLLRKKNGIYRLPPGPPGLPILGNLHMLGDLPHHSLCKLSKKYGPIMYIRLGLVPTMVISSPEMAELFLKTHDIVFASRPKVEAAEYMSYGQRGMGFSQYGPYWRNVRKLCTLHLLSNSKIESFKSMRSEEVISVVKSIKDLTDQASVVVDVSERLGCLMEDVTFRMVFGAKDDRFNLKPVIQEALRIAGAFNLADYVPYIGALDPQGWTRRMKVVSRLIDESFEQIIEEHVQNAQQQNIKHHQNDCFIDVMLSLMNTKDGQEIQLGRPNIKAIILDMFAGAMDTTANTIEWILSELLRHPRVMKLVQKELESVVGLNRMVQESDLMKLDYLEMVVKEGMRLHPVAPLLGPHESMEDIKINGYDVPKKSRVIVNAWAIGRDPLVWSNNADDFYPERFIGCDIDMVGHDFRLIPFGSGRRGCPGIQLGLTMLRLTLAQLVHCFNWKLPNGMQPHELNMTEKFGLTVPRAKHLLALPTYRLKVL